MEIDGNGDLAEVKDLQILVTLEFRRMLMLVKNRFTFGLARLRDRLSARGTTRKGGTLRLDFSGGSDNRYFKAYNVQAMHESKTKISLHSSKKQQGSFKKTYLIQD